MRSHPASLKLQNSDHLSLVSGGLRFINPATDIGIAEDARANVTICFVACNRSSVSIRRCWGSFWSTSFFGSFVADMPVFPSGTYIFTTLWFQTKNHRTSKKPPWCVAFDTDRRPNCPVSLHPNTDMSFATSNYKRYIFVPTGCAPRVTHQGRRVLALTLMRVCWPPVAMPLR